MRFSVVTLALSGFLAASCQHTATPAPAPVAAVVEAPVRVNPLTVPSTLQFQYPPFDQITDADYRPGFEAGMAAQRAEVDAIAGNTEPPTFDNTIVALERTGALLNRVANAFFNLNSSNTNDALQALEAEIAPKLSAHMDAISLDSALFARIDTLHKQQATLGLDAESAQLLARYHKQFVRAGAGLNDADKATLAKINEDISSLQTAFGQNVRAAMKNGGVVVDSAAELAGFSDEQISAAAEAAKERGLEGKWVITLQNTTIQPALGQLTNRALRERVFRASSDRANGGEGDNTALIAKLVTLRSQKAALLGYANFAAYALEDGTASTPDNVNKILAQLGPAALAKAKVEAADIQRVIDQEAKASKTPKFTLEPWDWAFYQEKVRKARYDFDESQVKPYFELDHVLQDGVFFAATQLYGITFTERKDLPVYNPDVRVFEVKEADGTSFGIILLDFFQRDNKQGGAWMNAYVGQTRLLGQNPVIVNNLNVPKPAAGQPVLLSFDDVTTMFHEFGHGLHGLFSNCNYPLLAGTATPPDFVEYPSQFNEMWAREPAVLANYAKHFQTGEAMPKALFDKVIAASTFDGGYAALEYLEAAKIDQAWHQLPADKIAAATADVAAFEAAALKEAGMAFAPVPPRYHSPYFAHVFAGGYESGYYAYIWSEVLARDSGAWFHAHGGLTRTAGDKFRADILSRGRTQEPSVLFANFYGGEPQVAPLLEYRGLNTSKPK